MFMGIKKITTNISLIVTLILPPLGCKKSTGSQQLPSASTNVSASSTPNAPIRKLPPKIFLLSGVANTPTPDQVLNTHLSNNSNQSSISETNTHSSTSNSGTSTETQKSGQTSTSSKLTNTEIFAIVGSTIGTLVVAGLVTKVVIKKSSEAQKSATGHSISPPASLANGSEIQIYPTFSTSISSSTPSLTPTPAPSLTHTPTPVPSLPPVVSSLTPSPIPAPPSAGGGGQFSTTTSRSNSSDHLARG